MSNCEGRGDCIQHCVCGCYDDEENNIYSEICTCSHRNHVKLIGGNSECQIYCKSECPYNCELIECHNYRMCGQKRPQHLLDVYNGMCIDCFIGIGRIAFLEKKDDCPICMENKDMILVCCGKHSVCLDCWKKMSESVNWDVNCLSCPMCRKGIWK